MSKVPIPCIAPNQHENVSFLGITYMSLPISVNRLLFWKSGIFYLQPMQLAEHYIRAMWRLQSQIPILCVAGSVWFESDADMGIHHQRRSWDCFSSDGITN